MNEFTEGTGANGVYVWLGELRTPSSLAQFYTAHLNYAFFHHFARVCRLMKKGKSALPLQILVGWL